MSNSCAIIYTKSVLFDSDEERAEYWVRISAMCCRSNELTANKNAMYMENLKP